MLNLLTNPVLIAVLVMCVLCLIKVNVLLAIVASALVGGLVAGMPLTEIMSVFIDKMGGSSETALNYLLLGIFAVGIYESGITVILCKKIEKLFGKNAVVLLLALAVIACFSQNLVPIHIAFIPILVPPLLHLMNSLKLDRRAAACALTFGLKAPYIALPVGFGALFHTILAKNMVENGMEVAMGDVWHVLIYPALSMAVGLLIAIFISYRKPREYKDLPIDVGVSEGESSAAVSVDGKIGKKQIGAIAGIAAAFVIQIIGTRIGMTGALSLGAFAGTFFMVLFGTIPFKSMDTAVNGGVKLMGFIAFVMLVASGFAGVIRATGGVDEIVALAVSAVGDNKLVASIVLLLLGLLITMGIGTSFGTIPVVATIYVPFCLSMGFSVNATIVLVGVAAALGDAGSPASDSTLGPTSGLNADGQHNHIWDTCVPTFLHYNIPLLISGVILSLIL